MVRWQRERRRKTAAGFGRFFLFLPRHAALCRLQRHYTHAAHAAPYSTRPPTTYTSAASLAARRLSILLGTWTPPRILALLPSPNSIVCFSCLRALSRFYSTQRAHTCALNARLMRYNNSIYYYGQRHFYFLKRTYIAYHIYYYPFTALHCTHTTLPLLLPFTHTQQKLPLIAFTHCLYIHCWVITTLPFPDVVVGFVWRCYVSFVRFV